MKRPLHRPPARALLICAALAFAGCSSDDDGDAGGAQAPDDAPGDASGPETGGDGSNGDGAGADGNGSEGGGDVTVNVSRDQLSGDVTDFGMVQITQPNAATGEEGEAGASFMRFDVALPALDALETFQPAADTCTVTRVNLVDAGTDVPDVVADVRFESLSAGEVLTLTSPAGSYAELLREQSLGFTSYELAGELSQPVPSEIVLDIPGDQYPAFSDVPVPDVQPLTGVGATDAVSADTVFTWDAGGAENVFVTVNVSSVGPAGDLLSVSCVAVDDGEFAFPAGTRAELGDGFEGFGALLTRTGATIVQRGNTLLLVSNDSPG